MSSDLTTLAREIFAGVLADCDAGRAVERRVLARRGALDIDGEALDVARFDDVRVAAVGKAADAMMFATSGLLDACGVPGAARRGLVVAHAGATGAACDSVERIVGGHPVPDDGSFEAGRRLLELFSGCTERTLAIFLLSGGGSALAEWPVDPALGVAEFAALNEALVRADLPIRLINATRKRLSAIKGGRLAMRAAAATQITLIVSDVAPGDAQTVASGPTVPDETTIDDALSAIEAPGVRERLTPALSRALARGALAETPRISDFRGLRSSVAVLLDCRDAAASAARRASRVARVASLGCSDGPLDAVVGRHLRALEALLARASGESACAVVSSGEVTLDVTGAGLGGRNQQTALVALERARESVPSARDVALLAAGTDGRDGPTDAAGAVADYAALDAAAALGLRPEVFLRENNSYRFFDPLGALIRTGPTGTNVRDVRVFLGRKK